MYVRMSVKAVHLELVSDLTTDAFIATLRRFIARRGKPSLIQSDHGSNFVGAKKELEQLATFLQDQKTQKLVSQFFVQNLECCENSFRKALELCNKHASQLYHKTQLQNWRLFGR